MIETLKGEDTEGEGGRLGGPVNLLLCLLGLSLYLSQQTGVVSAFLNLGPKPSIHLFSVLPLLHLRWVEQFIAFQSITVASHLEELALILSGSNSATDSSAADRESWLRSEPQHLQQSETASWTHRADSLLTRLCLRIGLVLERRNRIADEGQPWQRLNLHWKQIQLQVSLWHQNPHFEK